MLDVTTAASGQGWPAVGSAQQQQQQEQQVEAQRLMNLPRLSTRIKIMNIYNAISDPTNGSDNDTDTALLRGTGNVDPVWSGWEPRLAWNTVKAQMPP